jgi:hypothetical protein
MFLGLSVLLYDMLASTGMINKTSGVAHSLRDILYLLPKASEYILLS